MIGLLSVKLYAVAVLPNAGYIGLIGLVIRVLGFLTDIRISAHMALSADTKLTLFLYATDG
jgi:hypothetical protein